MSVKHYIFLGTGKPNQLGVLSHDGPFGADETEPQYVSATDYAALKARCEELGKNNVALKSRAEELQKTCLIYHQSVGDLEKERDSLRSQLEAANERHFQAVYAVGEEIEKNEALQAQHTAQPDGVDWRKLAEDAWNGWRIGKDIVTPMHALRDALTAAPVREDGVRRFNIGRSECADLLSSCQRNLGEFLEEMGVDEASAVTISIEVHKQALAAPAPAPSSRMADVRLWTWTDESNRNPNVYAVRYCGTEMFTTNSANAAKSRCDELNLAATVTLPDAKKCEADRGIDWYAAYERMAHNRNELWAKLEAVKAALAATKEGR